MTIDFAKHAQENAPRNVITFDGPDDGSLTVEVHDKYPQMAEVHVEGRRYVEVSVEMFIELMASQGFAPVVPGHVPTEDDNDEKRA